MDTVIAQTIQGFFLVLTFFIALVVSGALVFVIGYFTVLYLQYRKREKQSLDTVTLEVRVPKDNETKIDAAEQLFSVLSSLKKKGKWDWTDVDEVVAFEIVAQRASVRFLITVPTKLRDLFEKQVYAYYPNADISEVEEPNIFTEDGHVSYETLINKDPQYQPIRTYKEFPADSLAAILSPLSKMEEGEGAVIQLLMRKSDGKWKKAGKGYITSTKKKESSPDKATFKVDQKTLEKIDDKVSRTGFETVVRIVVSSPSKDAAKMHVKNIKTAFSQFSNDLNGISTGKLLFKYGFMIGFIYKLFPLIDIKQRRTISIFTNDELATLFHFPNKTVEAPHINWLKAKTAPVAAEIPHDGGTFIGMGVYRGVRREVAIRLADRRRHVYIIGKTGTGKSVLLHHMAMQDIKAGHGVCVIDPHGDLVEDILKYMPPERAEDVIYFDPSDEERPMGLNLLEAKTEQQKHFMTTAIINLMYKLYDPQRTGIIGPRFEHAVRNAMLTVMVEEGSTFIEIVRVLTDQKYVQELLPKLDDPIVRRYWTDQIAQTSDFHKSEVLDYIVSKFGRFVTNKTMRNIIGQSKSSFDFRRVMDDKKILLINLSKGRLGEENSQFLGLVLVPKILMAAMSRQEIPEEDRKDFFLYVDEFQNFATPDFATIMSEARKYRLNLTVANQFIGQMDEEVKNAVFGNVGTFMSYRVGTTDASYLAREFSPVFSENDLQNVERNHIAMKTIVDNDPYPAFTVDVTKDFKVFKAG
ncbi:MAG: type IV secretory system conjugative DNA transfer family protein, partial [Candidatus Roizmanbacteria bacterium]